MQPWPGDERGGQRRRPELRQREPRAAQGALSVCRALRHVFLVPGLRPAFESVLGSYGSSSRQCATDDDGRAQWTTALDEGTSPAAGDRTRTSVCVRGWWFDW